MKGDDVKLSEKSPSCKCNHTFNEHNKRTRNNGLTGCDECDCGKFKKDEKSPSYKLKCFECRYKDNCKHNINKKDILNELNDELKEEIKNLKEVRK